MRLPTTDQSENQDACHLPLLPVTTASRPKHLPALDGIRGLAVLAVFVFHYGGGTHSSVTLMQWFGFVNKGGWAGVVLFFVLSGFLITGILWDSYSDVHWWRKFFARRSLRIFPLYFLTLLLVVLAAIPGGTVRTVLSNIWIPTLFLENIPHLDRISESLASPLPIFHLWSIAVEEQFYLLWPFALYWCWRGPASAGNRSTAKTLALIAFVASALFRMVLWLADPGFIDFSHFLLTQGGALAVGGWLALAYRGPEWMRVVRVAPYIGFIGLVAFAAAGTAARSFDSGSPPMMQLGLPAITLFFAALLTLTLQPGVFERFFSMAGLR